MFHPWRALREREHVTVLWDALPGDLHALTDGETIWMDSRLLQVERRCAIAHELVHIERGTLCVDEREELRVRRITAQRLIDMGDLIEALKWSPTLEECADELWVTPDVLRDRLRYLSPIERRLIELGVMTAWHNDH